MDVSIMHLDHYWIIFCYFPFLSSLMHVCFDLLQCCSVHTLSGTIGDSVRYIFLELLGHAQSSLDLILGGVNSTMCVVETRPRPPVDRIEN